MADELTPGAGARAGQRRAINQRPRKANVARTVAVLAVTIMVGAAASQAWRYLSLDWPLVKARDSLREFQPEAAIERLTAVVAERPACAEAEFLLASAFRRAGRIDMVETHLMRAAELGWDGDEIDRQRCLTYFQVGDFRQAGAEIMERMLEGAGDDEAEEIYEAMGRGYTVAMLLRQAGFILESWLGWRPRSVRARLLLADVAALAGDQEGEINCYRQAVRFNPSSVESRRRLAGALLTIHEVDEAYELLVACLRDQPLDPDVLFGMAECQERRGQRGEARKLLGVQLASQPDGQRRAAALALLGRIALAERDYAEATRVLREAVEAHPANVGAVYSLSRALSHAGHGEEAELYLDRFRRLQAAEKKLDDLHENILKHPEDPDLRAQVGEALLEQGATTAGVNWLISVLYYHPSHPLTNRLLAEHYERAGSGELAARHRAIAEGKVDPAASAPRPLLVSGPAANNDADERGAR